MNLGNCGICNVEIYYQPMTPGKYAEGKGHVYSPEGLEEVRISSTCEYCFDELFGEPDPSDEDWGEYMQGAPF